VEVGVLLGRHLDVVVAVDLARLHLAHLVHRLGVGHGRATLFGADLLVDAQDAAHAGHEVGDPGRTDDLQWVLTAGVEGHHPR